MLPSVMLCVLLTSTSFYDKTHKSRIWQLGLEAIFEVRNVFTFEGGPACATYTCVYVTVALMHYQILNLK